jgi:hypothetical protein
MLDAAHEEPSARELGVAQVSLNRAQLIAPRHGPDPVEWLAAVFRKHKSFSSRGRVASMLAALRPIRADVYLRQVAQPLHMSVSELRAALHDLERDGFVKTALTIRAEALEVTLTLRETPPDAQSAPVVASGRDPLP